MSDKSPVSNYKFQALRQDVRSLELLVKMLSAQVDILMADRLAHATQKALGAVGAS